MIMNTVDDLKKFNLALRSYEIDNGKEILGILANHYGYNFWIRYNNMVQEQRRNRRQEKNRD